MSYRRPYTRGRAPALLQNGDASPDETIELRPVAVPLSEYAEHCRRRVEQSLDASDVIRSRGYTRRTHEGDVPGRILGMELGYEHLCLPMDYETTPGVSAVTNEEMKLAGRTFLFWPTEDSVTARRPILLRCFRAEVSGGTFTIHGRSDDVNGTNTVGDPFGAGYYPGYEPALLSENPEVGRCTMISDEPIDFSDSVSEVDVVQADYAP